MADDQRIQAPVANVHGNTPQNELSPIRGAAQLYRVGRVTDLYLCGGEEYRATPQSPIAYSGYSSWRDQLMDRGVLSRNIHAIDRPHPSHTGTEAQHFVRLAQERGWRKAFVIAPPLQILRAFVNNVTFVIRFDVHLKVYAHPGPPQPWHEQALHSQGGQTLTRLDSVIGEWERLNTWYDNEYDLVAAQKVLEYLAWRDGYDKQRPE